MPKCAWCKQIKPAEGFHLNSMNMLREVCMECEKQPLTYCGFCGRPIGDGEHYKISPKLCECMECHEEIEAIRKKNIILKIRSKLNQLIRQTNTMSEHLIGNLREKLFDTIDGLAAGTMSVEVAAQITDVAKTIIDSAKVENEFVRITGSLGSGFIPVSSDTGQKQIGGPKKT